MEGQLENAFFVDVPLLGSPDAVFVNVYIDVNGISSSIFPILNLIFLNSKNLLHTCLSASALFTEERTV